MKPWITFQEKIGYSFKTPSLLAEALTHKSYAHETIPSVVIFAHNERLEFLGDAVLDLSVSALLMHRDYKATEGELSKRRAALVNEKTLAEVARELELSEYVILGRGELHSKGHEKESILASTVEALLGAVFLDGGFDATFGIVESLFSARVESLLNDKSSFAKDYKSRLQEIVQSEHKVTPKYVIDKTQGPEHQKTFFVSVMVGEKKLGEGTGKSRKEAEQDAAQRVLSEMEDE